MGKTEFSPIFLTRLLRSRHIIQVFHISTPLPSRTAIAVASLSSWHWQCCGPTSWYKNIK